MDIACRGVDRCLGEDPEQENSPQHEAISSIKLPGLDPTLAISNFSSVAAFALMAEVWV